MDSVIDYIKNLKFTASFADGVDKYMWLQPSIGTMTFDNVTFDSTGCDWKISAQCMSGTPYTKIIGVAADVQCDNTVIFKNGDYTNLHTVAVLWTYSTKIDVTAAQIAAFNPGITVESGAKMNTVYGLATQTMAKGSSGSYDLPTACRNPEILIKSGATVAKVIGTLDNVTYTNNLTITIEQGANVTTVAEKGEGATVTGDIVVNNANTGSTTPETPAPETPAPETPAPSTPATADASEIVLFSFIALASLAGVAVVSKTRA